MSEIEAFAARLNGREYRDEIGVVEAAEAKIAGLLVCFGASDGLLEFRGVLDDEVGAWEGTVCRISRDLKVIEQRDDHRELVAAGWSPPTPAITVRAAWCPEGFDGSWLITADEPFAPFDIMEDGELYCRGCVIDARRAAGGTP
jgi:hypothetical protein